MKKFGTAVIFAAMIMSISAAGAEETKAKQEGEVAPVAAAPAKKKTPPPDGMPDFGADGLGGLAADKKAELAKGEIVFTGTITGDETKDAMIEAALVFDKSIDEVWELIHRTEDQDRYLADIKELKVIKKSKSWDNIEFGLDIAFLDINYRVIHRFYPPHYYFHWYLDPQFKNSLHTLKGYWRFFPYGEGKTLARYGSKLSVSANVPSFIQDYLTRKNVPTALNAVKKYVNSGGTWRRDDD